MSKELMVKEQCYLAEGVDLASIFSEEMEGMTPTFDRIKIPAGGGVAFEVPGDDPESPDMAKEFKAVILFHHPINTYYKDKFDGASNPPECGSMDGRNGTSMDGEIIECSNCPYSKFGSSEDGKGKACKQKRRMYLLREGEFLPTILTLPTGSLSEFSKFVMRLLGKGQKSNQVVTKFSLKKAQNSGGITYSQAVFCVDRMLTDAEQVNITKMTNQVKQLATNIEMTDSE